MKLLIFGGTGKTGQQLVEQALQQNHIVTAFVRTPSKLTIQHPNLRAVQGDVFDKASVSIAMENQDVVLSALGEVRNGKRKLSEGTQNIIDAMTEKGVKRLVYMTSLGVGDSKHLGGFLFMKVIVPLFLKDVMIDKAIQEDKIAASSLNWVIARPGGLTNTPKTGQYILNFTDTKNINYRIARADVADFMLKNIDNDQYLGQKVVLSYPKV